MFSKESITALIIGLMASAIVISYSTNYSIGITPDSVRYIEAGKNLITTGQLTDYGGVPFKAYPPLYPLLISTFFLLFRGAASSDIATIINILASTAIFYFSFLIFRKLSLTKFFSYLGAIAITFNSLSISLSSFALSEATFIALILATVWFALNNKLWPAIILSIALVATRYSGLLIITGLLIATQGRKKWWYLIPLAIGLLLSINGLSIQYKGFLLSPIPLQLVIKGILLSVGVIMIGGIVWLYKTRNYYILITAITYLIGILIISTISRLGDLDTRMQAPFITLILLGVYGLSTRNSAELKSIVILFTLILAVSGFATIRNFYRGNNLGFASKDAKTNSVIVFLASEMGRKIPDNYIYSNGWDYIKWNTGRNTMRLPFVSDTTNPSKKIPHSKAMLIWFPNLLGRHYVVPPSYFQNDTNPPEFSNSDGCIIGIYK